MRLAATAAVTDIAAYPAVAVAAHAAAGLGHNCEYSEKYFWQFVSQRSGWVPAAQAALQDYDTPSTRPPPSPTAAAAAAADANASQQVGGAGAGGGAGATGAAAGAGANDAATEAAAAAVANTGAVAGGDTDTDTDEGPPAPCSASDRHTQALLRHVLLAEAGCEAAAENAAWMLLHGQGAGGPQALDLAAHLLYRCVCWGLCVGRALLC